MGVGTILYCVRFAREGSEMGRRAEKIELSEAERVVLGGLIRAASTPQRLASRARMILLLGKEIGRAHV